jgi:hypothetical protein
MRGRVAVLVLFLVFSLPAVPQCSWTPRASAQFRSTALDVAVQDGFLWVATGYGVTLIDANTLVVADAVALPGNTRVVYADPRGVTYAGSGSRLYVLSRNGRTLSVVRFVDAGGTVNDIAAAGSYLFVATSNGIAHFDAIEATNPLRAPNTLPTTGTNVTSVAATATKLYAADGDFSVDIFAIGTPALPQRTGELTSLSRAAAVHAAGDTVFVSDGSGQNTDVFIGTTRIARLPVGTNAFAAFGNGVHFTAGTDFTLRAVDFNSTTFVKEIYEHTLSPIGGTDYVIHEIVRSGKKLYVAAGDIGLAIYDVGTLGAPYPIAAYRTGVTSSTVVSGDRAWFADANGTITETKINPSGLTMTTERTWTGGMLVHDVDGTKLLTSNGSEASIWSLEGVVPAKTQTSTFPSAVKAARFHGDDMVAVLADGKVWTGGATPQQLALPAIAFLDRAGTTWTFAENRDNGTTLLRYFPTADFSGAPVLHTIPGITTGLAASATRLAVYTFGGLRVLNVDGSVHATLQLSLIPQQFTFSGNDLLVLGDRTLFVYEDAKTLVRTHDLPANAIAIDAAPSVATIATIEGMTAVSYLGAAQPRPVVPFTSRYYSKVVAAGERAYLIDRDGIDVLSTATGDLPRYMATVNAAGIVDIAATPSALFTLSAAGTVTAYSTHGVALRQMTINEGPDAQPLAIDTAGNAVWVSISRGCLTGGCQNKVLVLDPATLSVTSTMNGAVVDVVASGNRAYALFELPNEVRTINLTNPLQPSQLLAIPSPTRATSVTARQGSVFVAGDRLYEYAENTLVQKAAYLPALSPDKAQQVRIDGNCLLIAARNANPETYNATTIIPAPPQFDVPSPVRGLAMLPGKVLLLTSHSLEVWSSLAPENPKRRAVR